MMAVAVVTHPSFTAAKPRLLFEGKYRQALMSHSPGYDVTPGGHRFVMIKENEQAPPSAEISIVLNWFEELAQLAPGRTN